MKIRLLISGVIIVLSVSPLSSQNGSTPTSQSLCDMPSSTPLYSKYCGGGGVSAPSVPAVPALTSQQQMGLAMGQAAMPLLQQGIHNMLYGSPAQQAAARAQRLAAAQAQQQAQQQAEQLQRAARQLNDSGIYLLRQKDYAGAIHEFQLALAKTPNDSTIAANLANARQQMKNAQIAGLTSNSLGKLLGDFPQNEGRLDFDSSPSRTAGPSNHSALGLLDLSEDSSTVDLRSATKTSIDPASLKSQLDGVLNPASAIAAPPNPRVELPQAQDIELLFAPPQPAPSAWPGPQRPANSPKLTNPLDEEEQTKAQANAIFAQPGGLDDILQQKAQEGALGVAAHPAASTPASK